MSAGPDSPPGAAPRWCARVGFLRELWAGRARVVHDLEVEASLREPRRLAAPAQALLAELVPERPGAAWLLADRPGDLPPARRRGVHPLDEFEALLAESAWDVAIVDLRRFFVDAASLSRFAARARGRLENRLETRAFRLLTALAEGAAEGRTVIVSTPAAGGGLALADFQELLEQHFARARVYALAPVPVAVVVDCGEVIREEDDEGDPGEEDDEDEGEGPPLAFDNRLGEDLRYDTYVALINAHDEPVGVTLVELPAAAEVAAGKAEARAEVRAEASRSAEVTGKVESRPDTRHDTRGDTRGVAGKVESRPDTRGDTRSDTRSDTRGDTKSDARADANKPDRPAEAARAGRGDAELDNLRIQLGQARRQVELAAIARQSLVEQLDAAQARVDALEDQVAELQRRLAAATSDPAARASEPAAGPATPAVDPRLDPRPDATQATVLALRWELEQTREELRKAMGRPVDALEREVAELRARLGADDPS